MCVDYGNYELLSTIFMNTIIPMYHQNVHRKTTVPSVTYQAQSLHSDWTVTVQRLLTTAGSMVTTLPFAAQPTVLNSHYTVTVQSQCLIGD